MTGQDKSSLVSLKPIEIVKTDPEGVTITVPTSDKPSKLERGKPFRQILTAFMVNIGTINTGLVFGFSAVAIPQLEAPDSVIKIDETQASWIASLSSASTPLGCILSGYLMDNIGRKKTLIITEVPLVLGWLLIAFATNVEMIYAGRLLVGLGSGMVGAPARVYTSETTQPHLRGMLTALASIGISLGVLLQYTLGSFLTWQAISGISAALPVIALIMMCFLPETPNYLVAKSKPDKAMASLARLRGSTYNLRREVDQLQSFAEKNNCQKKSSSKDILAALLSPATIKPFGILFTYFMIYQFSGVNTITFYAVEIFQDSGTSMDKYTCTIMLGVVRLIFTVAGSVAMRIYGRRTLTFISSIGCGSTMVGLGAYLAYKHSCKTADPPVEALYSWIPVACILAFTVACTLGFLVVPWVMIGELYPQKVRGIVGGLTTCSAHMFVFTVVKTYPFIAHLLQKHGVFILYGCISLFGTIFFYLCLPETKGKSLQEIEDYFSGRTSTLNLSSKKSPADVEGLNNTKPKLLTVEKDKLLP